MVLVLKLMTIEGSSYSQTGGGKVHTMQGTYHCPEGSHGVQVCLCSYRETGVGKLGILQTSVTEVITNVVMCMCAYLAMAIKGWQGAHHAGKISSNFVQILWLAGVRVQLQPVGAWKIHAMQTICYQVQCRPCVLQVCWFSYGQLRDGRMHTMQTRCRKFNADLVVCRCACSVVAS